MTDLCLLFKCNLHTRRPEQGCLRCETAIDCSRMNKGWGDTYFPVNSWFGPDAFIGVTLKEGWAAS